MRRTIYGTCCMYIQTVGQYFFYTHIGSTPGHQKNRKLVDPGDSFHQPHLSFTSKQRFCTNTRVGDLAQAEQDTSLKIPLPLFECSKSRPDVQYSTVCTDTASQSHQVGFMSYLISWSRLQDPSSGVLRLTLFHQPVCTERGTVQYVLYSKTLTVKSTKIECLPK